MTLVKSFLMLFPWRETFPWYLLFYCFSRCPECGRTPPGRKKPESFRKMLGRKLSVRKSVSWKSGSTGSSRSRDTRDPLHEIPGSRHQPQQQQNWIIQVNFNWDLKNLTIQRTNGPCTFDNLWFLQFQKINCYFESWTQLNETYLKQESFI